MLSCRQCSAPLTEGAAFCDSCGAPVTPKETQDALIGRTLLNQYVIRTKLGEGGFGAVYIAEQPSMGRKVAIKVLHKHLAHQSNLAARFRREGVAASRLLHASSVKMLNFGETDDGILWMAMELVEGETITQKIKREGPLPLPFFVEIMGPICEVLAEAHEKGIIHRDLKPENIMLAPYPGGKLLPKVLDFGVAGLVDANDGATKAGMIVGTPQYMSPEQWRGLQSVDFRTDIYALGVISYQCLTAKLPFDADTTSGWMKKHCNDEPHNLEEAAPGKIPTAVQHVIKKALAKEPADRFQSTLELKKALDEAVLPGAIPIALAPPRKEKPKEEAAPPKDSSPGQKPSPPRGLFVGGALVVLGGVVAALYFFVLSPKKTPKKQPPPATTMLVQATKPSTVATTIAATKPILTPPPETIPVEVKPPKPEPPPGMIVYEGGVFLMGSSNLDDQNPETEIKVAPFFLDRTEVSLAEYKGCTEAQACAPQAALPTSLPASLRAFLEDSAFPVINVTFRDAQVYCSWRAEKDGVQTRLPTEAEWEFAAREGGLTRSFPWGNTWEDRAAISGVGIEESSRAPKAANEPPQIGGRSDRAIHLIGNVSEWVDTKVPGSVDSQCSSDACRVIRGGSYLLTEVHQMTATFRNWAPRETATIDLGFRCAASIPPPK